MHTLAQLRAGQLHGLKRLDLAEGLTDFPREIFALADSLEVLNLSGNALAALPADLPRLHRLRVLFCSDNQFTEVPAVLGQCPALEMVGFKANRIRTLPGAALPPALRWLILTDNQLAELPAEIGHCPQLQKLMLAGNQLTALPETLANCTNLELLRIAANRLTELPKWLLTMPRLSWLAFAGNPFAEAAEAAALARNPIHTIDWADLTMEQQLGEGASGVIYRARRAHATPAEVAVKLFKGAVTSDGLPHSEMAACISAGLHPNLIAVRGKIDGHPAGAEGLVLELIAPAFGNLAGPPSLATCTRDVYAAGTEFRLETALRIATGIASAAAHLHAQGILHGDLYAHNILNTPAGDALLGDFGAACFFAPDDAEQATALQQLEVRAFGCLLEELLTHCPEADEAPGASATLWDLQRRCVQPQVAARPLFGEIVRVLEGM
ncbi:leucine-rich repeat-containing serine/threonine-protein kinase [Hymenobacter sp. DH14]|uniref:Leucine-rich repeat-containing serine/threonine-protein kinase n=1 Tax=Hymenobacter cyanobacteriorum TaxID=2926463 RepID=A0A9X2AEJ5_9BACT|nr:leucine-rich repeat-containing protein kinase family protein [Hymenobacter cyanobacteriorum]MCI1187281.1 leucine-rich repeat-containing serine/threonine-protein kinase [Hymenobacter cyanobacteriorum]